MNTFKKIAAIALAAATAATMAVTASAMAGNPRADIKLGALTPTYGRANDVISYTQLSENKSMNIIAFSSQSPKLTEGNTVLSVDFADPEEGRITDEMFDKIDDYMASLRLHVITPPATSEVSWYVGNHYKYPSFPLEITNGFGDEMNVIVSNNKIFKDDFNVTSVTVFKRGTQYIAQFGYTINNHHIVPNFYPQVGNLTGYGWEHYVKYNDIFSYKKQTQGVVEVDLGNKSPYGKTYPVSINGVRVADVTLTSAGKISVKNY